MAQATTVEMNRRGMMVNDLVGNYCPIGEGDGTVEGAAEIVMEAVEAAGCADEFLSREQVEEYYELWHELPRRTA